MTILFVYYTSLLSHLDSAFCSSKLAFLFCFPPDATEAAVAATILASCSCRQ